MPSALLVDTNFSSWPILQALEAQGIDVHVVGANPTDALAKAHARYHVLDYSDAGALGRLADHLNPDYLVPGCNDRSYAACAALARETGRPGLDSPDTTDTINHKALFRAAAARHGLAIPRVWDWPREQPEGAVIVKPVDAFSGKGVTLVQEVGSASLRAAAERAVAASPSGQCIVEEFVEGQMYSHSAFLERGRIVQDFWVIEHSSVNPFVVDTSHLALDLDPAVQAELRAGVERLSAGLGLVDGLLHTQFIVAGRRHVIVEATRRCPGDLYSQLVQLSAGFDYPAAYAAPFIGCRIDCTQPKPEAQRFIMRHTLTGNQFMRLQHLQFDASVRIARWVPLAASGDLLRPSPLGRIAILFAEADSREDLSRLAAQTTARRLFQVNPGGPHAAH